MRKEKGITLVALLITIVIMILLAGVTISVTTDMQEQINFEAFKTHLDILQTEVIEKYESISDEMKEIDSFETYTPEELVDMGFSEVDQNVYINWKTRQVKMYYKGQEYYSDKYNIQSNNIQENETDFDIDIEYFENRYKVTVKPKENKNGLEVSYRLKVGEGQAENNWILANGLEFEYVNYGIYEVRLADKNGNETIKTIEQTLETVASDGEIVMLEKTLGEKLINYQALEYQGSFNVVIIGKNLFESISEEIIATGFRGANNHVFKIGTFYVYDFLKPGDTYTFSADVEYEDITSNSEAGKPGAYFQGAGNITGWSGGTLNIDESLNMLEKMTEQKGKIHIKETKTYPNYGNWTTNETFAFQIRTNYITSGTLKISNIQIERGNVETEYESYQEAKTTIDVATKLPEIKTKDGTTHIYFEDENLGRIPFEVTYIKTEILE